MEEMRNAFRMQAKWIAALVIVLLLALVVFVAALAAGQIKSYRFIGQGLQMSNTITIAGKGEVDAVPDIAQFTFGVSQDGKTPTEAQQKVTDKMNPIIDKLKSMGIDEKDIQTTDYQLYPKYEYQSQVCPMGASAGGAPVYCPPNGRQVLNGYTETHNIAVKVRDVTKAGDVVAAVTALGITDVSGINFIVDKQDEKVQEARRLAIADAKAKADVLARDLGVHIVSIVSFNDSGNNYPIYATMGAMAKDSAAPAAPAPNIPQGQNKITSNVSIVYAID